MAALSSVKLSLAVIEMLPASPEPSVAAVTLAWSWMPIVLATSSISPPIPLPREASDLRLVLVPVMRDGIRDEDTRPPDPDVVVLLSVCAPPLKKKLFVVRTILPASPAVEV